MQSGIAQLGPLALSAGQPKQPLAQSALSSGTATRSSQTSAPPVVAPAMRPTSSVVSSQMTIMPSGRRHMRATCQSTKYPCPPSSPSASCSAALQPQPPCSLPPLPLPLPPCLLPLLASAPRPVPPAAAAARAWRLVSMRSLTCAAPWSGAAAATPSKTAGVSGAAAPLGSAPVPEAGAGGMGLLGSGAPVPLQSRPSIVRVPASGPGGAQRQRGVSLPARMAPWGQAAAERAVYTILNLTLCHMTGRRAMGRCPCAALRPLAQVKASGSACSRTVETWAGGRGRQPPLQGPAPLGWRRRQRCMVPSGTSHS